MNQGMSITIGVMFPTCPTKKYRTKVNNPITQSQLRLSGRSTVVRRKQFSASKITKSTDQNETRVSESCFNGQFSWEYWARK